MTSPSKVKGDRAELECARLLDAELGQLGPTPIRRKLGAGRADDSGDIDGLPGVVVQVKNWKNVNAAIGAAMRDLPTQKANAKATHGVALVRCPGGRWIAVMDLAGWCGLYREAIK